MNKVDENDDDKKKVNNEILKRAQDIYEWMGKYNPFSYDNYSVRIRKAIQRGSGNIALTTLKRKLKDVKATFKNEESDTKRPKTEVETFVLNTGRDFNFDVDDMTTGEHPLKRSVAVYLRKLSNEHWTRMMKIKEKIRDEVFVYMKTGTPGQYVNVFTMDRAISAGMDIMNPTDDDKKADYEKIFPALRLPTVEYKKWKRYAAAVRKLIRRERKDMESVRRIYPEPMESEPMESEPMESEPMDFDPGTIGTTDRTMKLWAQN